MKAFAIFIIKLNLYVIICNMWRTVLIHTIGMLFNSLQFNTMYEYCLILRFLDMCD